MVMIESHKRNLTEVQLSKLKALNCGLTEEGIYALRCPEGMCATLIYPTDDLLLSEYQFKTLVRCAVDTTGEKLFAIQVESLYSNPEAFFIPPPYSYELYRNYTPYSMSVICPDSCRWYLLIDESLEGGLAIIIGKPDFIEKFKKAYGRSDIDICRFVDFSLRDYRRNNHGLDNLSKIIKLIS